jgi:hypothetical protein
LSRSASASKGFLFLVTRFASPRVRFKQTASKVSRRTTFVESRHASAACWDQSKNARSDVEIREASADKGYDSAAPLELSDSLDCWLRGLVKVAKRYLIQEVARNLGLILRKLF